LLTCLTEEGAPFDVGKSGGGGRLWSAAVSAALLCFLFFPRQKQTKSKAAETAALQSPHRSPKSRGTPAEEAG
jgi:hypothetical protein